MGLRFKTILLLPIITVGYLSAQGQKTSAYAKPEPNSWQLSGDLFLDLGLISKKPAFIRGQLPYQRWLAGWHVELNYLEKIKLDFLTAIAGGTPFDNPERFDYSMTAQFDINRTLGLLWGMDANYNVNQYPIIDPAGRISNTGLSEMFAGLKLTKRRNGSRQIKNETYFTKNIRGNIPSVNNNFTGPYVGWRVGNNFSMATRLNKRHRALSLDIYFEGENRGIIGKPAAAGAIVKLEHYLGRHFMWQSGAAVRRNIINTGASSTKQPPFSEFLSIAPIGRDIFMIWIGPHFIF